MPPNPRQISLSFRPSARYGCGNRVPRSARPEYRIGPEPAASGSEGGHNSHWRPRAAVIFGFPITLASSLIQAIPVLLRTQPQFDSDW